MKLAVVGDAASVNVQRWCEGLAAAGATVEVVSFAPAWSDDIPVRQLQSGDRLGKARYLLFGPLVRRIVARMAPDVVIGYYVTGYGTLARLAGQHPLVQVTAGDDVLMSRPGTLAHRMATQNLRAADLVTAWAPHMAAAIRRFGVPEDRILVQPRGIPLGGYPDDLAVAAPGTRLVSTRSLHPEYRYDLILNALADPSLTELTLTVVGGGPERSRLQTRSEQLGIEGRVTFLGQVDNDQLPAVLARHDVYVSAIDRDGVSASLLEAMAAGLLPVVVAHPANEWWIEDGVTGLMFEGDDLVPALRRATSDGELRSTAARVNPAVVRERGDLQRNMKRFAAVLRDVAG